MNRELILSYSEAFLSFLFRSTRIKMRDIRSVYLFGSFARGDYDKDSDVDIFIDAENEGEVDRMVRLSAKKFYQTEECRKFRLLGIENSFSVKCGNIMEWDLRDAVMSEGIVLYSSSASPSMRKYFLLEIKTINNVSKRNRIIRKLSGRREAMRKEKGIAEEMGGIILDSRHYIIPAESIASITKILSKENALFGMREIWMP